MNKEYITRKATVAKLNEQITLKATEIKELRDEIAETKTVIESTSKKLDSEELTHQSSRKLSVLKRTMTLQEYREARSHLEDWRKKVIELNASLEQRHKELVFLQDDLARERPLLMAARTEIMTELVNKELEEFTKTSGESFKNLVLAVIAKNGRNKPHSPGSFPAYQDSIFRTVCETLLPAVFGTDHVPDHIEASQFVNEKIESEHREAA
ncbi:MAG: hypothetical protein WAW61_13065 [Methylococcaceae bacterium]